MVETLSSCDMFFGRAKCVLVLTTSEVRQTATHRASSTTPYAAVRHNLSGCLAGGERLTSHDMRVDIDRLISEHGEALPTTAIGSG